MLFKTIKRNPLDKRYKNIIIASRDGKGSIAKFKDWKFETDDNSLISILSNKKKYPFIYSYDEVSQEKFEEKNNELDEAKKEIEFLKKQLEENNKVSEEINEVVSEEIEDKNIEDKKTNEVKEAKKKTGKKSVKSNKDKLREELLK
jgi:hypothetical protein